METLLEKKARVFDQRITEECEAWGSIYVIGTLLLDGFTKEELLEMDFNEEDIDRAIDSSDN